MTHDTDALVSALRDHADLVDAWGKFELGQQAPAPLRNGDTAAYLGRAADAIDRLTRELGEARQERDVSMQAASTALEEADAARAGLAECQEEREHLIAALTCIRDYGALPRCINAATEALEAKNG